MTTETTSICPVATAIFGNNADIAQKMMSGDENADSGLYICYIDFDTGERGGFRPVTKGELHGFVGDFMVNEGCILDGGYPHGTVGFACQVEQITDPDAVCIIDAEKYRHNRAKELDRELSALQLSGTPGSYDWWESLSEYVKGVTDSEHDYRTGEQLAERWAEMRMGAQSEEGFWEDQDYSSSKSAEAQNLFDKVIELFPASYLAWQESATAKAE